ncbi:uncharacterized protein LOC123219926 [Mangifera indica]|uniref:uncharacterized protein LOC123219926 n=1 Tax=Mangifera indica TaxID=29780 RepID=UPI001CFB0A3D|nr:uncharacterized protein LOC123219926 [Mangifera indica]
MVSVEIVQATDATTRSIAAPPTSPRISFSAEFLDENNFISISPHSETIEKDQEKEREKARINAEFEFLSNNNVSSHAMLTADELFFEGKLLPFWQMQHSEKLNKITLKSKDAEEEEVNKEAAEPRVSWFVDDDPSPRPPKCTVLWKELLRLKKQRASSLSPSSSSSSTSSSSSSLADVATTEAKTEGSRNREKHVKRIKKGLERTRSASIRIRPMINVPICTQVKNSALPPLFPLKKGRLER